MRTAITLSAFAILFLTLVVVSYTRKSATWDEPQHLVAGYEARAKHDYRFDPEHPPFLRLWASLLVQPTRDFTNADAAFKGVEWLMLHQFEYCHQFLFRLNDADHLLYRARFMNALWGVLLGILLFSFIRERLGYWPALVGLTLYTVEPNLLAHAGLITTDFGITCFAFGTVYFLWRTSNKPTLFNWAGLVLFFMLAQISKFTGVLLVPVVALGLIVALVRKRIQLKQALAAIAVAVAVTYLAIWAVYSFRYYPAPDVTETLGVREIQMVKERVPQLARIIGWIENHRLLPSAYCEGFLLGQTKAQERSAYLAGKYSLKGWWYFFPIAFLIKTPIALLVLFTLGLVACLWRWRTSWADDLLLLLPIAVFMGTAMVNKINIGVRHVLPIYPFVIVLAAMAISEFFLRRRDLALIAVVAAAIELATVYPDNLAFFNLSIGGPNHGAEYLADSNLDWGQDLKGLSRWMKNQQVTFINLSYFGTAEPVYYGINCTHLPGAPFYAEVQPPKLPGYVAVSETNLRGVYLEEAGRAFYRPLVAREPVAIIGHTIRVYWMDKPWW